MKTTVRKDVARGVVRVRPKLALQGHPCRLLQEVVSNNTNGMSVSSRYGQVSSWCLGTAFPHMYDVRRICVARFDGFRAMRQHMHVPDFDPCGCRSPALSIEINVFLDVRRHWRAR
jgi:hypothetical protein